MMKLFFFLLLFKLHFPVSYSASGETSSMESVPDLQKSMYKVVDGFPCVRLLNLSGDIGCSNPRRDVVAAPVLKYEKTKELDRQSTILVSMDDMEELFKRILNDSNFAANVGGVLVESWNETRNKLKEFSPSSKFPQAEFSLYPNTSYEWNPIGSGIMWRSYNFPVFLLSESSTLTLQEVATRNEIKKKAYTSHVAEFDLVMQTTKVGIHDSESCLKEEACLPLGGYSVWSSLPPINSSASDQSKPIILTVASMDAASFFRDKSLGAESPISGMISLLAAVDALSHVEGLDDISKQLVFLVFTGESWGYLGSRRFLFELDMHSDSVNGIDSDLIELVVEIGSTGNGFRKGEKPFFAHTSTVSSITNATLDALKRAQGSLKSEGVNISSASTSNPGIPPSSLMAFLRRNSSTPGIVLEDFDTAFANKFYQSHLDDSSNVNSSAIAAAASLVARTLYILANDGKNLSDSALNAIKVNASLVEELMGCLLDCDPGLSCELVKKYISPSTTCPSHYAGVILGEPSPTPYPGNVDDISRFLWNYLADKTSISKANVSSNCSKDCKDKGGACIKFETDGKGVCAVTTTRYVPAYSTRLKFDAGIWKLLPPNSSDPMGMVDPVWTESNWNTIGLRVYTIQDASYDRFILLSGIVVTLSAYTAIVITRALITKALKRD